MKAGLKVVADEELQFSVDTLNSIYGDGFIHCESQAGFQDLYFGHVDFHGSVDGKLHVSDLKTGWGSNEDHIAQQEGYALALLDEAREGKWPRITDHNNATLHLVWEDQKYHYSWDTTYDKAKAKIMEILAKRLTPGVKPRANKNCQWCKNLAECEAVNHEIVSIVSSGLPTKFESPEDLSKAMIIGDLVSVWSKKVKELGLAHVKDGNELPNFKHSKCRGREIAPNLKEAWLACKPALEKEYGKKAKEKFLEACTVSSSKLRKMFSGKEFPAEKIMKRGESFYRLQCKKKLIK